MKIISIENEGFYLLNLHYYYLVRTLTPAQLLQCFSAQHLNDDIFKKCVTSKRQLDLVNVARDEKIVGVEFLIGRDRPLSHFLNAFFRLDVLCIPVSCYLPATFALLLVSNNLMLSKSIEDYWPLNRTHHSSSRARLLFI